MLVDAWPKCDEWLGTSSLVFIINGGHISPSYAVGVVDFDLFLMKLGVKKVFSDFFARIFFFRRSRRCRWKKIHICLFFNWLNKFSNKKTNANLVKTRSWCFFSSSDYLIESVFFGGFSRLFWDWNTGMTKTKRKLSLDEIAVKYSYTR